MVRTCLLMFLTFRCIAQDINALVDKTVEQARRGFNVPGISVAVVKDGNVVLSKGYGIRRLGDPRRCPSGRW
jgi:CubicO group peptidase (beta-lactamase class C family)